MADDKKPEDPKNSQPSTSADDNSTETEEVSKSATDEALVEEVEAEIVEPTEDESSDVVDAKAGENQADDPSSGEPDATNMQDAPEGGFSPGVVFVALLALIAIVATGLWVFQRDDAAAVVELDTQQTPVISDPLSNNVASIPSEVPGSSATKPSGTSAVSVQKPEIAKADGENAEDSTAKPKTNDADLNILESRPQASKIANAIGVAGKDAAKAIDPATVEGADTTALPPAPTETSGGNVALQRAAKAAAKALSVSDISNNTETSSPDEPQKPAQEEAEEDATEDEPASEEKTTSQADDTSSEAESSDDESTDSIPNAVASTPTTLKDLMNRVKPADDDTQTEEPASETVSSEIEDTITVDEPTDVSDDLTEPVNSEIENSVEPITTEPVEASEKEVRSSDPVEDAADLFASDPARSVSENEQAEVGSSLHDTALDQDAIQEAAAVEDAIAPSGSAGLQSEEVRLPNAEEVAARAAAINAKQTEKVANEIAELEENFETQTLRITEALEAERQRAAAQEAEIAALKQQLATALTENQERSSAEIQSLRQRIDTLQREEQQKSADTDRQTASLLALIAMQRPLEKGEPFTRELQVLKRSMAGVGPDFGALETVAESGLPTIAALKEDFTSAIRSTLAENRSRAKGPVGHFMRNLQSLVSVRPANPQEGESVGAIISRAEAYLERDDIARAVNEVEALGSSVSEPMQQWVKHAKQREAAMGLITDIHDRLLAGLNN